MVSAGHPQAVQAGVRVLRDGGSAVDAAVAVQMVLTLVEPQASGIGGGAFALHWDGARVQAWDGRETAPAAVDEALFLQADGQPMPYDAAEVGGLAVGVPGALKMLEHAHRQHGRLAWARLFEPAIELAESGFAVSPRLHALLLAEKSLKLEPRAVTYFYRDDGSPHAVGHVLRNPALAQVLRAVAQQGAAAAVRTIRLGGPRAEPGHEGQRRLEDRRADLLAGFCLVLMLLFLLASLRRPALWPRIGAAAACLAAWEIADRG